MTSKELIEYIYDFAWHWGRFCHIGDAEKTKAAISERFQLPEEFIGESDTSSQIEQGLKPEHKCIPIARAQMSEGRNWWLGKITETVKEFPVETHCLHLKTPLKDVVFLCNAGDFQQLSVLCRHALGYPINESWMESQLRMTSLLNNEQEVKMNVAKIDPIVYNDTVKEGSNPLSNSDVSALTKNLHSEEALNTAAESLKNSKSEAKVSKEEILKKHFKITDDWKTVTDEEFNRIWESTAELPFRKATLAAMEEYKDQEAQAQQVTSLNK